MEYGVSHPTQFHFSSLSLIDCVLQHPASRMAFCHVNYYTTGYSGMRPAMFHVTSPSLSAWRDAPRNWETRGNWSVTTRGFFAFPFDTFTLDDGTSTKDILLFVFKRAVCKTDLTRNENVCYNIKVASCFQTSSHYTNKTYPSQTGTSEFNAAIAQGIASWTRCGSTLLSKISSYISKYVAGV